MIVSAGPEITSTHINQTLFIFFGLSATHSASVFEGQKTFMNAYARVFALYSH